MNPLGRDRHALVACRRSPLAFGCDLPSRPTVVGLLLRPESAPALGSAGPAAEHQSEVQLLLASRLVPRASGPSHCALVLLARIFARPAWASEQWAPAWVRPPRRVSAPRARASVRREVRQALAQRARASVRREVRQALAQRARASVRKDSAQLGWAIASQQKLADPHHRTSTQERLARASMALVDSRLESTNPLGSRALVSR